MKKLVFFLFILITHTLYAQINRFGVPFITNYSDEIFKKSPLNWAAIQDHRGVMYFGNDKNGVLEYDGVQWRQIDIKNNTTIRALNIDAQGTVYVGAVGEYGYLYPDSLGSMTYRSLSDQLDSVNKKFNDVWQIINYGNKIIFNTGGKLFIYSKLLKDTILSSKRSFFVFNINDSLYLGNFQQGILKMEDNYTFTEVTGTKELVQKNIFSIMPYDKQQQLIGTFSNGLGIIDHTEHTFSLPDYLKAASDFCQSYNMYSAYKLHDGNYVLSTVSNGSIQISRNGNIDLLLNNSTGLQNNVITYTYQNTNQDLWLLHEQGISKVEYTSPFRLFNQQLGLEGWINDLQFFDNTLYVATTLGLFYKTTNKEGNTVFEKIADSQKDIWDLLVFQPDANTNILLAASGYGVFEIKNKTMYEVDLKQDTKEVYSIESAKQQNAFYLGGRKKLLKIAWNKKKYEIITEHPVTDEIFKIYETTDQSLWLTTKFNGIVMIPNGKPAISYNQSHGLPSLNYPWTTYYRDNILVSTPKGIYAFDLSQQRFIPYTAFGEKYANGSVAVKNISIGIDSTIWLTLDDKEGTWIEVLDKTKYSTTSYSPAFKRLPKKGFSSILHDSLGVTWLAFEDKLYSFNRQFRRNYRDAFNALVRKVSIISNDSVLFGGSFYKTKDNINYASVEQPGALQPILPYEFNALVFEFAAPYFEEENRTRYSYKLSGFDNTWSRWTNETKAVYTNIPEGEYTFMVKAKNVYDNESTVAMYHFEVKPPFYRTWVAYIIYILVFGSLIYLIISWNTARLRRRNEELERLVQERTAEVVKQKNEIEQKNTVLEQQKHEITLQAQSLQKANEEILHQKDEIEEKNEEITSSITYASRIQNAIIPPAETFNDFVSEHFILWLPRDIVSGDFYWVRQIDNRLIVTAADCTGHGVPGAFMSMLGVSFLNDIVSSNPHVQASDILNEMRNKIKTALRQTGKEGEAKDGMDMSLFIYDRDTQRLQFAGANNPVFVVRANSELVELKPHKNPIGIFYRETPFTSEEIELQKGDTVYACSDGYEDQFGGPSGRKFMTKRLKEIFCQIHHRPMSEQREYLLQAMNEWRGSTYRQIDDILIVGIKV